MISWQREDLVKLSGKASIWETEIIYGWGGGGMARSEEQEILDEKNGGKEGRGWIFATSAGFGRERSSPSHLRWNFMRARYINSSLPLDLHLANSAAPSFLNQVFRIPNLQNDPRVEILINPVFYVRSSWTPIVISSCTDVLDSKLSTVT